MKFCVTGNPVANGIWRAPFLIGGISYEAANRCFSWNGAHGTRGVRVCAPSVCSRINRLEKAGDADRNVTKVEWTNPHAYLYMDANDQNGQMQHWKLEMGSPGALTRAGWNRNMVKMGDQITIDGWLSKTKNDQANVNSVSSPTATNCLLLRQSARPQQPKRRRFQISSPAKHAAAWTAAAVASLDLFR